MFKIQFLHKNDIYEANENDLLLDVISKNVEHFSAPCGGKKLCKKCLVKLIKGQVGGVVPDENGYILSCQARVQSDLILEMEDLVGGGLSEFIEYDVLSEKEGLGIILDIGTTTVAACLIDLKNGKTLEKLSALNPQSKFGADVLSRIQSSSEGKLKELQSSILNETEDIILKLSEGKKVSEMVIGANTTMLHLFLGIDPKSIGVSPFVPVFTSTQVVKGKSLGLSAENVRLLPSASAYIGSDITAGILSCGMNNTYATKLFVDIGTNGEVVLAHKGNIYATSTAAGPALEGACIEWGIGGIPGAIDKVEIIDNQLKIHTIENKIPIGICGSGLIDIISILLDENMLDETGAWNDDCDSFLQSKKVDDKIYLTNDIYLSQKDIRQFQLAKAAISAGIKTLLREYNISFNQVETTYIAGGLGYFMNLENAIKTGLIPKELFSSLQTVGNTCLSGARLCLCDDENQRMIEYVSENISIVDLSLSVIFQEEFIDNIGFFE